MIKLILFTIKTTLNDSITFPMYHKYHKYHIINVS